MYLSYGYMSWARPDFFTYTVYSKIMTFKPFSKYIWVTTWSCRYFIILSLLSSFAPPTPGLCAHTVPPLREVLFSQVVFSSPTHPPTLLLSPSLPACFSCWKWLSVYFYPLVLYTLTLLHPFSLFLTIPTFCFLSFSLCWSLPPVPLTLYVRIFKCFLDEAHLQDGEVENCLGNWKSVC